MDHDLWKTLMRGFGRATIVGAGAVGVTLVAAGLFGLNEWVLDRTQRTWSIPAYEVVFPVLLVVATIGILAWNSRASFSVIQIIILGMCVGYLAGVLSYLVAPVVSGEFTLREHAQAVGFGGVVGYCGLALSIPVLLLGWLYGGLSTVVALFLNRLLQRLMGDASMASKESFRTPHDR